MFLLERMSSQGRKNGEKIKVFMRSQVKGTLPPGSLAHWPWGSTTWRGLRTEEGHH